MPKHVYTWSSLTKAIAQEHQQRCPPRWTYTRIKNYLGDVFTTGSFLVASNMTPHTDPKFFKGVKQRSTLRHLSIIL